MSLIFDNRSVSQILDDAINANPDVTQKEIAEVAGLNRPNVIYMFKTGLTKVPLDKAGKVVSKLGLDEQEFWFKCFKEYLPAAFDEYQRVVKQPVLSKEEIKLIKALRCSTTKISELVESLK